eukprot:jgi/Botrbrau1/1969/Bobra.0052s0012.1
MPKASKTGKGTKRTRTATAGDDDVDVAKDGPTIGQQTSQIGNKIVRSQKYAKLKQKKNKEKKIQREKQQKAAAKAADLGLEGPPKKIPKTLENTREPDETIVAANDEEVQADNEQDEFASYFRQETAPKVLLTTCYKPTGVMFMFMADIIDMLPNATFYKRQGYSLKKIVEYATAREFTDIMVFNEDRKKINGLHLIHLPDGPTAHFKLTNLKLSKDIRGHGRPTGHKPELILNNFSTRLGQRLGRMLASLFPAAPQFPRPPGRHLPQPARLYFCAAPPVHLRGEGAKSTREASQSKARARGAARAGTPLHSQAAQPAARHV